MADRLKPEHVEIVKKIRVLEKEIAPTSHDFKKYKNYYVPQKLVAQSKTVLSFGVGGDVGFEKLMLHDNHNLKIELFDPTPFVQANIHGILGGSAKKIIKGMQEEIMERYKWDDGHNQCDWEGYNKHLAKQIKYTPYGYAPTNGKRKFYFKQIFSRSSGQAYKPEVHTKSFSAFDPTGNKTSIDVNFKNLKTIMKDRNMDHIDILKTDIEGFFPQLANEILDNKIKFKFWATEVELGLQGNYEQNFDEIKELCKALGKDNYVFVNRQRQKAMLELLFLNKDESRNI